ncbi:TSUP family transporter, partial [Agrobacterium rubi]|uniref:TSUP family transporter n=1 Tax=Agrobacterium rubi TaxID=28099 RepID=UPI00201B5532
PGLIASTGMPIIFAIGSSLVAVTAFGLTTALNYAISGYVDWILAAIFIGGGVIGGLAGASLAKKLSSRKGMLNSLFAALIFVVAAYMLYRSAGQFMHA